MGGEAAHAGHLVAEALLGEDLGDAVLGHPGLVAVPKPVRGQARLDREPAGKRCALGDDRDAVAAGRKVLGVWAGAPAGGGRPGGDRDAGPGGLVGDDQTGGAARRCFIPAIAGGPEHPPGVVAAPIMPAVRPEEDVSAAAAVLADASAWLVRMISDLAGDHFGEESGKVNGEAGLPARATVGVVLGRDPVKLAVEFAELPFDVDLAREGEVALQADRLAPPEAGVADCDDHGEVLAPAREQRGPFGEQQDLKRRRPGVLWTAFQPAAGPAAAIA